MTFVTFGQVKKFQRNEHVEIHVRELVLFPDDPDSRPYVEIREYLLNGEVYGNGIVLPVGLLPTLVRTLELFSQHATEAAANEVQASK